MWRGDYETGNLVQWSDGCQCTASDRYQVVRHAPGVAPRQGHWMARVEVRPGDDPIGSGGERAEVLRSSAKQQLSEGDERWYGWSVYFPTGFPYVPKQKWNVFTQFHHSGSTGQVPLQFEVNSYINADNRRVSFWLESHAGDPAAPTAHDFRLGNFVTGRWIDFVLHAKFSSNPNVGFIAIWKDGRLVVRKTKLATLYAGYYDYLKQGYYRAEYQQTAVLYLDAMKEGRSYAAVAP